MASKVFTIILVIELGKPHVLPLMGRNPVRGNNDTGDRGNGKKRMAFCNGMHRGTIFALSRKGADLP
jgi:hypothetical protein